MKKILVTLALALVLVLGCVALASADVTIVAWGDLDSVTTLDGHSVTKLAEDQYDKNVRPTCTSYGAWYYKCNDPTHLNGLHEVIVDKLPHSYVEDWDVYVAPTCTQEGSGRGKCSVCGAIGDSHIIKPNGHSFSGKAYEIIYPATCTQPGYGVVVCDVCGVREYPNKVFKTYDEAAAAAYETIDLGNGVKQYVNVALGWVKLQKIAHDYTEWTYTRRSDCYVGGMATRTCVRCGDVQYIDETTPWYVDPNGNVLEKQTNPKTDKKLVDVTPDILKKNNKYALAIAALDGKTFENRIDLEKAVADLAKQKVEIVLVSDNEKDCYTRTLKYHCPICDSKTHIIYGCAHPEITVTLLEPSHVWEAQPVFAKAAQPYKWLSEYYAAKGKDSDVNEYVRCLAVDNLKSVAPTCELPGIALYKCKWYDKVGGRHGEYETAVDGTLTRDGIKTVLLPPTEHKWGDWVTIQTYEKDGRKYIVHAHQCKVCGKTVQETIYDGDIPVVVPPTGLEKFVERCYGTALKRMSDPAGFKYWVNLLQTKEKTAQEVAYGFVFSPEMNADRKITEEPEALLKSLYALYLDREPDPEGLEYWKQRIADGLTMEELNYGFAQSVEFQGIVASFGLK